MSDPSSRISSSSETDWLTAKLAGWPDVQRSDSEKEASVEAIMARVASGSPSSEAMEQAHGNIFASPLGQTPEESHNTAASGAAKSTTSAGPASSRPRGKSEESMSMSSDRERDRRSLQDLAKLAGNNTPSPGSVRFDVGPLSSPASSRKDEDSGLVNLMDFAAAPASSAAPAPAPASVAPISAAAAAPASVRAPLSAPPVSAPAPSSIAPAVVSAATPSIDAPLSAPQVAEAAAVVTPVVAQPVEEKKGNAKIILFGGLFAAAAIAAGAFFAIKGKPVEQPTAMNAPAEVAPAAKAPEKAAEPVQATTDDKTPATEPASVAKAPVAVKAVTGGPVAKVDPAKPEVKEEKKVEAKDLPASAGGTGDLGAAMRQAAGPGAATDSNDKPSGPQFAAGSVPQKPSQGAVTGALGAVLSGARNCVGADDPISRATVTFASAGNVTGVTVSGGAAGKPAEACIKAALSKAHVAPFAEASYSAPVTIRH